MLVTDKVPLLRTFRAELTKRSSMLVDEDMQEYFEQLADFEGYGGVQAMGKTRETFGSQTAVNISLTPDTARVATMSASTASQEAAPIKWRLKSTPVSAERLSNKVASISSLKDGGSLRGSSPTTQTLITVRQGCLAPKGTSLNVVAILNPQTGRKVTLAEAIKLGVFDPKTGTIFDSRINKRMNVSQAVANKYMTNDLMMQLTATCGIRDPYTGNECTLLEAIQKGLFNPNNNTMRDPKSGTYIPLQEAVARGLLSNTDMANIIGEGETVTFISQVQPVSSESDLGASTTRLGLGDLVETGLYNAQTGKVLNPFSGKEVSLIEAVELGLVNPARKEIKDAASGKLLTLSEAVNAGIIDPETGLYLNKSSGQKIKLDDAYQRKLINKPSLLPDALHEGAILDNGKILDAQTGRTISLKTAMENSVLDVDAKCIVDSKTGDVLSITEALENGLMDLQMNIQGDRTMTLAQAVDKGVIKLVKEELVFSKPCIKDTRSGRMMTVQQAIAHGLITSNGDFVDTESGRRILLKAAAGQGFVSKEAADLLLKDSSMKDASGRNVSILKAIQIGLLSPDKAEIRDPRSRRSMSLQQAAKEGLISTDDASTVLELLSPAIAQTTVTTRLQPGQKEAGIRSIAIADAIARGLLNEKNGTFRDPNTGATMPVQTAIEQGLLRLSSQWPGEMADGTDGAPESPKSPLVDVDRWMREIKSNPEISQQLQRTGQATVEAKLSKQLGNNYSFTQTVVTKPKITEHVVSETKHFKVKSVVDPRTKTEISVNEAVHRGLLDMSKGLFIHPITDERMSIEAALSRGFVRGIETSEPSQGSVKETKSFSITGVIHPRTGQTIGISQAVKEGILDLERGIFNGVDSKGKPQRLKISEAVDRGFVIADDDSTPQGSGNLTHETKKFQLKSVVNPVTRERLDVGEAIKQGLLDERKGLYIHPGTGEKLTIPEAIERKLIDAELISVISNAEGEGSKIITTKMTTMTVKFVIDPRTGEHLTVSKAVDEGILDSSLENYINPITGEVFSLNDAIDKKLVIVQQTAMNGSQSSSTESIHIDAEEEVVESNLIEEISSETVTFSINSVIDPRTMEMMSYDEAVRYGVLDVANGMYRNPLTGDTTPINIALEKGLIHGEVTSKVKEEDKLLSSVDASHLAFPLKKISSVVDQRDGGDISVVTAIKDGIIDVEKGTYFDVNTIQNIPLEEALKRGYIKMSKTTDANEIERMRIRSERKESERERRNLSTDTELEPVVDMKMEKLNVGGDRNATSPFASEVFNYTSAVEKDANETGPLEVHQQQGVRTWRQQEMAVVDTGAPSPDTSSRSQSPDTIESLELTDGMSFQSALKLGLIDARTGRIRDPETGKYITVAEAIDKDVLDKNKPAMRDILTGKPVTLQQCIDKGIIDPRTGKINDKRAKAEKVALRQDIDVKQSKPKPLNLMDCVASGLYDPDTGMFTDPRTQKSYTLKEAIAQNIVDGNLVSVMDPQSGERLPLASAIRQGLVDGVTAEVVGQNGETIPLMQAIQEGLFENAFDKDTCTFHDTLTGVDVPLDKALTDGHIRSDEAKVLDTSTGETVSLDVAMRKGLVDLRTGAVTDKATGQKMSPQEALKLGLLAVVGAPVLAGKVVYDAIKDKTEKMAQEKKDKYPARSRSPEAIPSPRSPAVRVNGSAGEQVNGMNGHSPQRQRQKINGLSPMTNGEFQLPQVENYKQEVQAPRTTIVYAKPGDQITPSPPQQFFPEASVSADEYHTDQPYTGVSHELLTVYLS